MENILSKKDITIAILISYLLSSYIQADFNPFNWDVNIRIIQLFILFVSLFTKAMFNTLEN